MTFERLASTTVRRLKKSPILSTHAHNTGSLARGSVTAYTMTLPDQYALLVSAELAADSPSPGNSDRRSCGDLPVRSGTYRRRGRPIGQPSAACRQSWVRAHRSSVLIMADTIRVGIHLSAYGYARETTPVN